MIQRLKQLFCKEKPLLIKSAKQLAIDLNKEKVRERALYKNAVYRSIAYHFKGNKHPWTSRYMSDDEYSKYNTAIEDLRPALEDLGYEIVIVKAKLADVKQLAAHHKRTKRYHIVRIKGYK